MEQDRSLSQQQEQQFNDFSNVQNSPGAPMKFDGKEIRGQSVSVVTAPKAAKGSLALPIIIVVALLVAIIVIVVVSMNNGGGEAPAEDTASAAASSVESGSTASADEGDKQSTGDNVIKMKKPADWDDEVYVYVYNENGGKNEDWPGKPMKKESDGTYSYEMNDGLEDPLIIFNAKTKQYPKSKGLDYEPGKLYDVEELQKS